MVNLQLTRLRPQSHRLIVLIVELTQIKLTAGYITVRQTALCEFVQCISLCKLVVDASLS
jgi:hypothetical protein